MAVLTHGETNVVPVNLPRAHLGFKTGSCFREAVAVLTRGETNVVPVNLPRAHLGFRTGTRFPKESWDYAVAGSGHHFQKQTHATPTVELEIWHTQRFVA